MVLPHNLKNETQSTGSTDLSNLKTKSLAPFNPNIKESRNNNAGHASADGQAGQGNGELTPSHCTIL
ncbi:hypothetical protein BCR44DRAFT_54477 [Catenaria anguillulae PL171]|uniref:Uncharacterized protein n=1 Tax=Catenaria anguillulae PL171 TaxID=765915 RepID=A0A1Y2HZJ1_9FUNG|nr:hypothetical protein BCR44DRAFT_54477 [Catenaria anguillulae PL171]